MESIVFCESVLGESAFFSRGVFLYFLMKVYVFCVSSLFVVVVYMMTVLCPYKESIVPRSHFDPLLNCIKL